MEIVNFTPWTALAGGALIGLAASVLALGSGRIAGISGIAGGLFLHGTADRAWRVAFLAGLVAAPWLLSVAGWPGVHPSLPPDTFSATTLIVAGLLVGLGTRLANGCTSGHGVCGLARLSPRSLVAVMVFMSTAALTTGVVRHLWS